MPQFVIICLANSRKMQGRCIAGLRTDGAGWIRPVRLFKEGSLFQRDYTLNDRSEVRVLDVVRIGVSTPRPVFHQPENWVVDNTGWILIDRPVSAKTAPFSRFPSPMTRSY